jgi:diadenosine tetraphosphatase ApaH/serine/threonine PP2A family protein phosphatase
MRRTLVVGDVHGCLAELDDLLTAADWRAGRDRLVFVGDLVDRGPDGPGVVRRVREIGAEVVMGNHEEMVVRWARHEARRAREPRYENPMKPPREGDRRAIAELGDDGLDWLSRLPVTIRLDDGTVVVHAGLEPCRTLAEQDPTRVIRVRYVDETGHMKATQYAGQVLEGYDLWSTRWRGPESVVYGHNAHSLGEPRVDEPAPGVFCHGIDTGCVYGGRLTALVLPGRTWVQTPARQAYAVWKGGGGGE